MVIHVNELAFLRKQTVEIAEQVMKETGVEFEYTVGTMIEVPRAALTADEIAMEADFFSFGTNDLTQTTFGFLEMMQKENSCNIIWIIKS